MYIVMERVIFGPFLETNGSTWWVKYRHTRKLGFRILEAPQISKLRCTFGALHFEKYSNLGNNDEKPCPTINMYVFIPFFSDWIWVPENQIFRYPTHHSVMVSFLGNKYDTILRSGSFPYRSAFSHPVTYLLDSSLGNKTYGIFIFCIKM